MANWLGLAGGAAQGYNQSVDDERRRQEFNSMQKQRDRVEQEQKRDDAISAKMRNVRPAGDIEAPKAMGQETEPGFVGPGSGTQVIGKRTPAQVAREQADIVSGGGDLRHLTTAAALRTQADAADDREFATHQRDVQQAALDIGRLNATPGGHIAAAKLIVEKSKALPEGHQMEITMAPDGSMLLGPKGVPGEPVTPDLINKHIVEGQLKYSSPQMYKEIRDLATKDVTAAAAKETAGAATTRALSERDKNLYETTGPGGEAQRKYMEKHGLYFDAEGQAALMNANTHRATAANAIQQAKFGAGIPMIDKNTGETVFVSQNSKTGEWEQKRFPANLVSGKSVWDDEQKHWATLLGDMQKNGTGLYQPGKDGKVDTIAIENYQKEHRIHPSQSRGNVGGGGDIYSTLKAAGPQTVKTAFGPGTDTSTSTSAVLGINPRGVSPAAPAAPVAPAVVAPAAPAVTLGRGKGTAAFEVDRSKDAQRAADAKTMTPFQFAQKYYPERVAERQ